MTHDCFYHTFSMLRLSYICILKLCVILQNKTVEYCIKTNTKYWNGRTEEERYNLKGLIKGQIES